MWVLGNVWWRRKGGEGGRYGHQAGDQSEGLLHQIGVRRMNAMPSQHLSVGEPVVGRHVS
ncbi:hypothetical protein C9397_21650 [Xanthomonas vasicola pv. vasculorum]|uniref:Uncharacterized protein n=1 Tax=Xanthomonas vasicola pv. vasculorum TaxID=325776 RepID=A0AAE8FAY8_XANVA|nr:hypothetical protein C7V42_03380 [Xanthomonas vasicola pv. vasculorum]AZR28062.1 hypothetical protein NX80_018155 [Xanthomonas vasicola pv. arecae]AZR29715.1 hypothetical protein KWO_003305 [Xanthomonas vasicola pv. musacearum NCPPB 4379]AZR33640.1 hypothetical protein NX08_003180 [Xanthomonas vasicola]RRJ36432.1 hypothetical protein EIM46_19635 [Xanthomonas vasicola pv. musacearum]